MSCETGKVLSLLHDYCELRQRNARLVKAIGGLTGTAQVASFSAHEVDELVPKLYLVAQCVGEPTWRVNQQFAESEQYFNDVNKLTNNTPKIILKRIYPNDGETEESVVPQKATLLFSSQILQPR